MKQAEKQTPWTSAVTCRPGVLLSKSKRGKSCLTATNTGYGNRPTATALIRGRAALRLPVRRRRCAFMQHPRFSPPLPTAPPKRYSDSEEFVLTSISSRSYIPALHPQNYVSYWSKICSPIRELYMLNAQHVSATPTAVVTRHIWFVAQTYYWSNSAKPIHKPRHFSLTNQVWRFPAH